MTDQLETGAPLPRPVLFPPDVAYREMLRQLPPLAKGTVRTFATEAAPRLAEYGLSDFGQILRGKLLFDELVETLRREARIDQAAAFRGIVATLAQIEREELVKLRAADPSLPSFP